MMTNQNLLPISAAIITRDAALTIRETLSSLAAFDEVVVYDNGSTDATIEIAETFGNVALHRGEFSGFGPTKNKAASFAKNDWIFSIDADERISPELARSLTTIDLQDEETCFSVQRANYFMGRHVSRAGWGHDWLVRLYNRKATQVRDIAVHEVVLPPAGGTVIRLTGELSHDAAPDVGSFLTKIDRYSEIRRFSHPEAIHPALAMVKTVWAFLRSYFLRFGFLEGWRGLVIAVSDANGVFYKYFKPYADRAVEREKNQ